MSQKQKKAMWFEVLENEQVEDCLQRMKREGYTAVARREEPLFSEENGQLMPIRQLIKFKGVPME